MRRSPRARGLAFRIPSYDTPRVAPHNNPQFHVDRTHAAGGVCEQTKTALRNIYIDDCFTGILLIIQSCNSENRHSSLLVVYIVPKHMAQTYICTEI